MKICRGSRAAGSHPPRRSVRQEESPGVELTPDADRRLTLNMYTVRSGVVTLVMYTVRSSVVTLVQTLWSL